MNTGSMGVARNRWEQESEKNKADTRDSEAGRLFIGHLCVSHNKMVTVVKFRHGWRPWKHCNMMQVTFGVQVPRGFVIRGKLSGQKTYISR